MDFYRRRESCRWRFVGGEKVEEKMGLVRLKEEKEEDRRLPPKTAAIPKADELRSLTPISSAVAEKPLIECHVKHSSWKRDFVVLLGANRWIRGFMEWAARVVRGLMEFMKLFMEFQEKSTDGLREHEQN